MANEQKYIVSACLTGMPCRFDGASKPCAPIVELARQGRVYAICPECLGGLKSPRLPCEQRCGRVICKDGRDMTGAFNLGAERAFEAAIKTGCRTAILKSRSPSCGVGEIYDGTFSHKLVSGNGIWAQKLLEAGFTIYDEEHLPRDLVNMVT